MCGISGLDEASVILGVSTVCNICYGVVVLAGFIMLPRIPMLAVTAMTLYVGPVIVLIVFG